MAKKRPAKNDAAQFAELIRLPGTPESRQADHEQVQATVAENIRHVRSAIEKLLDVIRQRFKLPLTKGSDSQHTAALYVLHQAQHLQSALLRIPRSQWRNGKFHECPPTYGGGIVAIENRDDFVQAMEYLRPIGGESGERGKRSEWTVRPHDDSARLDCRSGGSRAATFVPQKNADMSRGSATDQLRRRVAAGECQANRSEFGTVSAVRRAFQGDDEIPQAVQSFAASSPSLGVLPHSDENRRGATPPLGSGSQGRWLGTVGLRRQARSASHGNVHRVERNTVAASGRRSSRSESACEAARR